MQSCHCFRRSHAFYLFSSASSMPPTTQLLALTPWHSRCGAVPWPSSTPPAPNSVPYLRHIRSFLASLIRNPELFVLPSIGACPFSRHLSNVSATTSTIVAGDDACCDANLPSPEPFEPAPLEPLSSTPTDEVCQTVLSNAEAHQDIEAALDSLNLPLSTELVDDVLQRLRYEEKPAFRFFTWAARQRDYSHQHHTFNFMIDVLSSTKYKAKQYGMICDILDHMKRKKNAYSVSVDALMGILKAYGDKHLTHLSKFVKKKRVRVKTQPEINAFNLLIDSLCKCGLVTEAQEMARKVKNKLTLDANTYNILFFGWCRARDPKRAMEVLDEMILMGHPPENFTYNAAIEAFCSVGMVAEARELFEYMRTKGSTLSAPTAKTYSVMIVALAKNGKLEECSTLLSDMRSIGCLPDVSTYKELIEGMCVAGKTDEAYQMLDDMASRGYPADILTYNCFLKVLCHLQKADEALRLCDRMIELNCEPSVQTYNFLLKMFYELDQPDRALDIWHEMDRRSCQRDVDSYCIMIDGLFGSGRTEDAFSLLEEVMDRRIKLPYRKFDFLLSKLTEAGNLRAIHRLSEHMKGFYNCAMARRYAISQKKRSISLRRR